MQIPHFAFAGTTTYPPYADYLISKSRRPRFVLSGMPAMRY
jgi:hypothetical protein